MATPPLGDAAAEQTIPMRERRQNGAPWKCPFLGGKTSKKGH